MFTDLVLMPIEMDVFFLTRNPSADDSIFVGIIG